MVILRVGFVWMYTRERVLVTGMPETPRIRGNAGEEKWFFGSEVLRRKVVVFVVLDIRGCGFDILGCGF